MRIDKPTDALGVGHPTTLLVGQPGICKTSLAYSFERSLVLNFDGGAHRAVNRRGDTATFESWADVTTALTRRYIEEGRYTGIAIDTVERALQLLTLHICDEDLKCALRGGGLNPKGWGVLKQRFATWVAMLRSWGLDVLFLAHAKEERDGDRRVVRADIPGGSLGEVMKLADFVGYLHMRGTERVCDFTISDRFIGKDPAGFGVIPVPPIDRASHFLQDLVESGRAAVAAKNADGAALAARVEVFAQALAGCQSVTDYNEILGRLRGLQAAEPMVYAQARHLLLSTSRAAGFRYDVDVASFVDTGVRPDPRPQPAPATPGAPSARAARWQPGLYSALTNQDGAR